MKWKIVSVGRPSFSWVREGVEMYLGRLRPLAEVEWVVLKRQDAGLYLKASEGWRTLALDERGALWSTSELAARAGEWETQGRGVAVWIGGADGLGPELRARASQVLSFGRLTLMHELALLAWSEQMYRVECLRRGHPYHRE